MGKPIISNINVPHPPRPTVAEEDRALNTAIAYTRYLQAKHPNWSAEKLQKKVGSHLNIKFV